METLDPNHPQPNAPDSPAPDAVANPVPNERGPTPWLESVTETVMEQAQSVGRTFAALLAHPKRAPNLAASPNARPVTYLIAALVGCGLAIETALLYRGRAIDENLFAAIGQAISSWGLQEIFLLTIPPIIVVWASAAFTSRLAAVTSDPPANDSQAIDGRMLHGLCHVVGTQLILVTIAAGLFIAAKICLPDPADDHRWTNDATIAPVLIAIALVGWMQLNHLLNAWGTAGWSRRWYWRVPFSLVVSVVCLAGVLRIAAETFDFHRSKMAGQRLSIEAWSGKARVLADVLDSHVIAVPTMLGRPPGTTVELTIALTNVTNLPHAVPRPHQLRLADKSRTETIRVDARSTSASDPGWVLQAGETKIVSWLVKIPPELRGEELTVAKFTCLEIDHDRWHREIERPIGAPADCYLTLRCKQWQPSDVSIAAGPSSSRTLDANPSRKR
jgi:hypothetical protein